MTVKIDGTNTEANPAFTGADTDTGLQCGTDELKLVTGGTERIRVDSSGQVILGHGISSGNSSTLRITGGTNGASYLEMGDVDDTDVGQIAYYQSSNAMGFRVNAGERMRIDSSGRVGIGLTSPSSKAHIKGGSLTVEHGSPSTGTGQLNINCENNSQATFSFDDQGHISFGTAATPHNQGSFNEKLRIQSGGGISFNGDTAQANALDDYEEGTWTPTLNKSSGDGAVSSPTAAYGYYRKVGNLLFLSFYWYKNSGSHGSNSGVWYISGVPFSLKTQANGAYQSISGGYFGFNGQDYFGSNSHRWQAHNLDGNQTLSVYGPERTTNWSSGYMEVSGSGVLMVL